LAIAAVDGSFVIETLNSTPTRRLTRVYCPKEDLIPPFAILAFDNLDLYPWRQAQASSMMKGKANVWGEDAGQQEVLNWFALAGAMEELGARLE
jgi:hypothetical protein